MQHLDAISLGVFSYLQAHERVSRVKAKPFVGASQIELRLWEQKNSPYMLPDDVKRFYSTTNGLSVQWFAPFRVGHFSLNSLQNLQRLSIKDLPSRCRSVDQHRLDLRKISHQELIGFCLEASPKYGTVALVYLDEEPQVWFKDLRGSWSFLAETFTNYYRMMLTHLGIISWQTIFSDSGVDPMRKVLYNSFYYDWYARLTCFLWVMNL
ncbi:hypothetical protein V7S43_000553 [Phytophthora oleae]|uniref:Knr4/Smi1-like domain-containing protein n=1 Tax=Phytophthora oleae TaxID=2107226 RepID=A0ABD3G607_9STRA